MRCKAAITQTDGTTIEREVLTVRESNGFTAILPRASLPSSVLSVSFLPDYFTAAAGEEGYFVLPGESAQGVLLSRFRPRPDTLFEPGYCHMGCLGMRRNGLAVIGIARGMRHYFSVRAGVENGRYFAHPFYRMDGEEIYEDISVTYTRLPGGTYADMARCYRDFQLREGGCVPLCERMEKDPRLKNAAESIAIRIRQGWKPVPSPVEHQTPENEPPMHVACTFDRVGELIDEMARQDLKKGEICLVGWNQGGHDGAFPQIFPPDARLGGQEALSALIRKARAAGLNIVCHTSSTAAYEIADCWDEEYLVKNRDGSLMLRPYCWGGGRPHKICPRRQYERFDASDLPKLAEMGFSGIHYIDVMTILPLVSCFDPRHPVNHRDSAAWYRKTMALSRQLFGGFSSEGGYDFAADLLDYCMYTAFHVLDGKIPPLFDENIPFWQLVYHGIILYNPCTDTLNYAAKGADSRLKYLEYGGRPLVVFYANFAKNNQWMGKEDFLCDDDAQLKDSVARMKQMADDYEALRCVRYAFMDNHEKIGPNAYRTTYSNGISIEVDYDLKTACLIRDGKKTDLSRPGQQA